MKNFFKDFKAFISRGNVMDLAVGMIIGSAVTAIVTALSNNVLKPLINWVIALCCGGNANALESALTFLKRAETPDGAVDLANSIYIDWGALISAIINFFLIALVLFLIVKAMLAAKGALTPKYYGYDKKEYFKLRKEGKTEQEIAQMAKERDELAEAAKKAEEEEAAKHTTQALLEDIKNILKEQAANKE